MFDKSCVNISKLKTLWVDCHSGCCITQLHDIFHKNSKYHIMFNKITVFMDEFKLTILKYHSCTCNIVRVWTHCGKTIKQKTSEIYVFYLHKLNDIIMILKYDLVMEYSNVYTTQIINFCLMFLCSFKYIFIITFCCFLIIHLMMILILPILWTICRSIGQL